MDKLDLVEISMTEKYLEALEASSHFSLPRSTSFDSWNEPLLNFLRIVFNDWMLIIKIIKSKRNCIKSKYSNSMFPKWCWFHNQCCWTFSELSYYKIQVDIVVCTFIIKTLNSYFLSVGDIIPWSNPGQITISLIIAGP